MAESAVESRRYSVEQIILALEQVKDKSPIRDVCRRAGISRQTFSRWKKMYAGILPSQARELKHLREENTRLKRLVAALPVDTIRRPTQG